MGRLFALSFVVVERLFPFSFTFCCSIRMMMAVMAMMVVMTMTLVLLFLTDEWMRCSPTERGENVGHKWTLSAIFLHLCWAWLTVRLLEKEKGHSHFRPWLRDDVMFFFSHFFSSSLSLSCVMSCQHIVRQATHHYALVVVCRQYLHSHETRILFSPSFNTPLCQFGVLDSLVYCIREKRVLLDRREQWTNDAFSSLHFPHSIPNRKKAT